MSVLDGIGNTPCVELKKVVPSGSARILAKLEWANPTGSMKDRMARAAIERAEQDGRLPHGGTVVEYTAGTTGISEVDPRIETNPLDESARLSERGNDEKAEAKPFGGVQGKGGVGSG